MFYIIYILIYIHLFQPLRTHYSHTLHSPPRAGTSALKVYDQRWTKANSPWATRTDCVWPTVASDTRLCNDGTDFMSTWGQPVYTCFRVLATDLIAPGADATCGSNYDWCVVFFQYDTAHLLFIWIVPSHIVMRSLTPFHNKNCFDSYQYYYCNVCLILILICG